MSAKGKIVWVRSDHLPSYDERKRMVTSALEVGLLQHRAPGGGLRPAEGRDGSRPSCGEGDELFVDGKQVGVVLTIRDHKDLEKASVLKGKEEFVLVDRTIGRSSRWRTSSPSSRGPTPRSWPPARAWRRPSCSPPPWRAGVDGIAITIKDPSQLASVRLLRDGRGRPTWS